MGESVSRDSSPKVTVALNSELEVLEKIAANGKLNIVLEEKNPGKKN